MRSLSETPCSYLGCKHRGLINGTYGTVVAVPGKRWAVALHDEGGTGEYGHLPAQANVVALKSNCITTV
jgi:hypothetical protein